MQGVMQLEKFVPPHARGHEQHPLAVFVVKREGGVAHKGVHPGRAERGQRAQNGWQVHLRRGGRVDRAANRDTAMAVNGAHEKGGHRREDHRSLHPCCVEGPVVLKRSKGPRGHVVPHRAATLGYQGGSGVRKAWLKL